MGSGVSSARLSRAQGKTVLVQLRDAVGSEAGQRDPAELLLLEYPHCCHHVDVYCRLAKYYEELAEIDTLTSGTRS